MIIISRTTANEMMMKNSNLNIVKDVYSRDYLLGAGAEIIIFEDDSPLIEQINARRERDGIRNNINA